MPSILTTTKGLLGIRPEEVSFDGELIVHINSAFDHLRQIGIGPKEGFSITDNSATWENFFGTGTVYESVKTFIFLKVKMLFDPPTVSSVLDSFSKSLTEIEWRLNVESSEGTYSSEQQGEVL